MDALKAHRLVKRLLAHGKPVKKTTTGFELERGEFLCRMAEMSALRKLGLVEKMGDDSYWLTADGKKVASDAAQSNM